MFSKKMWIFIFLLPLTLPIMLLVLVITWAFIFNVPPEQYDFTVYSGHVTKVEIVDWSSYDDYIHGQASDNYRVILTLDESQYEELLISLSEVNFYRKGPGDPPGFGGRCFLISLDDGSYRVVGRYGYAQYRSTDRFLDRYTSLWDTIREDDFEDLFEPYLGR